MTIDSRTLYATLLGLKAPWEITDVEVKQPPGEVHIRVALPQGTLWVCPQCHQAAPIHDHLERRWRHLGHLPDADNRACACSAIEVSDARDQTAARTVGGDELVLHGDVRGAGD